VLPKVDAYYGTVQCTVYVCISFVQTIQGYLLYLQMDSGAFYYIAAPLTLSPTDTLCNVTCTIQLSQIGGFSGTESTEEANPRAPPKKGGGGPQTSPTSRHNPI
jgi:hypothetical protein